MDTKALGTNEGYMNTQHEGHRNNATIDVKRQSLYWYRSMQKASAGTTEVYGVDCNHCRATPTPHSYHRTHAWILYVVTCYMGLKIPQKLVVFKMFISILEIYVYQISRNTSFFRSLIAETLLWNYFSRGMSTELSEHTSILEISICLVSPNHCLG